MLRTLGLLGVFGGSAWIGVRAAWTLKLRYSTIAALSGCIQQLTLRMEYTLEPLCELCMKCKNEATALFFDMFVENLGRQINVKLAWQQAMAAAQKQDAGFAALKAEEVRVLEEYAEGLGASAYSVQAKRAELLRQRLRAIEEQAKSECLKKGRLYQSMGMLCGIALALLLL